MGTRHAGDNNEDRVRDKEDKHTETVVDMGPRHAGDNNEDRVRDKEDKHTETVVDMGWPGTLFRPPDQFGPVHFICHWPVRAT